MAPTPTYPNRSDLRQGQYGSGVAAKRAAKALPPGRAPSEAQAAALAEAVGPLPGSRGPLTRPTERPDEPVTAGMSIGPGAGPAANPVFPMAPPAPGSPQAIAETLRAIVASAPNANLIAVLREVERQSGGRQAMRGSQINDAGA